MGEEREMVRRLVAAGPERRRALVAQLDEYAARLFDADWPAWVHAGQEPPASDDWRVWVMLAGRGFGKTRAGAEWVSGLARAQPGACFALVAASIDEARRVMIEGPSGLLAVARSGERAAMRWEPSRRRLQFASGAEAFVYSGAHADSLRGPQHHYAWCDELAKWKQAQAVWDNLMLGLRMGERPRALVTTTPRSAGASGAALKAIIGEDGTARSGGATAANPHLPNAFVAAMERKMGGTRLGRQELGGELIEDLEGALWPRDLIERCRIAPLDFARDERPTRIVIGVDPPASVEGACGIVACGLGADGIGYVLGDHSAAGLSPDGWARKVAAAAETWGASQVIAETNQGGDMVVSVLRGAGIGLAVRKVQAAEGKVARAAPVATAFESKRAKFAGCFPELEDELAGLTWNGDYQGPGRSPDRADAMVWALTELLLKPVQAAPRVLSW